MKNAVAVIGAGTMGASITTALIAAGYKVFLQEISDELLEQGLGRIDKFLASKVKKGLAGEDAEKQRALVTGTTSFQGFLDAGFVIEAASENIELKTKLFAHLDEVCSKEAILATNTSSLSITQIAGFTKYPGRVVGMHFFNPAHIMKLVEVIPGLETSKQTIDATLAFARDLGKLAVRVEECPSFLVNRLLGRYMNESLYCLQEGLAGVEEIDKAACDFNMPIGPLALRDMNGADIGLAVAKFNHQEYGERYAVPEILELMVKDNLLGQKTGSGFYTYDKETRKRIEVNPQLARLVSQVSAGGELSGTSGKKPKFTAQRLFLPMINESFLVLQERICNLEDLDPALMAGLGMRKGPLALASEMGLDNCLSQLQELFQLYGERFRPAGLLKRYVWAGKKTVEDSTHSDRTATVMGIF
jgi:3-hydroxyacyl-CoA dehydrogenase